MKKIIAIIFLLMCGLSVYWMLSPNIYLFTILGFKNKSALATTGLMILVRNFLPDLLWAIAINLTARLMASKKFPRFYIYTLIILPFLSEILQYNHLIPGTFDLYDLLIYSVTYLFFFNPKLSSLCKANSKILSAP